MTEKLMKSEVCLETLYGPGYQSLKYVPVTTSIGQGPALFAPLQ